MKVILFFLIVSHREAGMDPRQFPFLLSRASSLHSWPSHSVLVAGVLRRHHTKSAFPSTMFNSSLNSLFSLKHHCFPVSPDS